MPQVKILDGKYIVRTSADSLSYVSNTEIRFKMRYLTTNVVTLSSYKTILKHRAVYAIHRQPYYIR